MKTLSDITLSCMQKIFLKKGVDKEFFAMYNHKHIKKH